MNASYSSYPSAGLFKRLASMVYDLLILVAIWLLIGFLYMKLYGVVTGMPADTENSAYRAQLPFTLFPLMLAGTFVFYSWFWTHGGQTLGMRAWRLQVVDAHLDGRPLRLLQCLSRFLMALISLSTFGLGYLWVLVSPSGDSWHDSLSGTRTLLLPKEENKKVEPYRKRK